MTAGPVSDLSKLTPKQRALLERRMLEKRAAAADADVIPRRISNGAAPLSFAQERLWVVEQITPGSPAYHIADAFLVEGELDVAVLRRALEEMTARHESLRTTFTVVDGQPVQVVAATGHVDFQEATFAPSDDAVEDELQRLLAAESERPFDLERGPLLRVRVFHADGNRHVLLLTMHHIVSDAWSRDVLFRELSALYDAFKRGCPSPLVELPIQYADYATWQRTRLTGEVLEEQMTYWRDQLADIPTLELPAARRRAAAGRHGRGASTHAMLPRPLSRAIKDLCRAENVTVSMLTLAAFSVLLQRYCGSDDIVVGSPVAGREREELNDLVGFFVNMLVMRTRLDGDPTGRELLARVRAMMLDAYDRQEIPFEKLVDQLVPDRDLTRNPLFQVAFGYGRTGTGGTPLASTGLTIKPLGVDLRTTRFDLETHVWERDEDILVALIYDDDLFDAPTMQRMLVHYEALLEGLVADPDRRISRLPLLDEDERHRLTVEWNDTTKAWNDERCVHELFEAHACQTPDALAVAAGDQRLSYGELNSRANRVAHTLRSLGVEPGMLVGLCVERGLDMVVGMLGIVKAGGAYLPLDPTYPRERLAYMLEDSAVPVLLTQEQLLADMPEPPDGRTLCLDRDWSAFSRAPEQNPTPVADPTHLVYAIYTSGSTGRPKGVEALHRGLANLVHWHNETYGIEPADRATQVASIAFDACVWELWPYLAAGASVHVVDDTTRAIPARLWSRLASERITVAFLPTPLVEAALREPLPPDLSLRAMLTGGDRLQHGLSEALPFALVNHYGPTENTVVATCGEVDARTPPPIGRPIANVRVYVLDRGGSPVPVGVPGELYIGGSGLAHGYLNAPALTSERYVPDPFSGVPGARLYRTGDLVRWSAGGEIEFIGRLDHQVKVRGFRIELGEIEAALVRHPAVRDAVVLAREDEPGRQRLVAYYSTPRDETPAVDELRAHMRESLPDYMNPAVFVEMPSLPLTSNGKVDRDALPAPQQEGQGEQGYVAPRTPVEHVLVRIWSELLRVDRVGVNDNFFELGGDSILSIQVIAQAREAGVHLAARQMFQHQTVAELAAVAKTGSGGRVTAEQGPVVGDVPLTPIQRWFFTQDMSDPHHFNHATLFAVRTRMPASIFREALRRLLEHHDALRMRFERREDGWRQRNAPPEDDVPLITIDLTDRPRADQLESIRTESEKLQRSLKLGGGPLLQAALFDLGDAGMRLLVVIHHLVVDVVSWRILGEDLQRACESLVAGEPVQLPPKTTSFLEWARRIQTLAEGDDLEEELDRWLIRPWSDVGSVPPDREGGDNTVQAAERVTASLTESETSALLQEVPEAYNTQINDVLLTGLATAMASWTERDVVLIDLEGHGREDLFDDVDISRTVGWFTTMFPVVLDLREARPGDQLEPGKALKLVKEQLRSIPGRGIGYGLLRYLSATSSRIDRLARLPQAQVSFNYLGQFDQTFDTESTFGVGREPTGAQVSPRNRRSHLLDFGGSIVGGQLKVGFTFSADIFDRDTVDRFAARFMDSLREVISHCRTKTDRDYTPSDFPVADLDEEELSQVSALLARLDPTDAEPS